MAVSTKIQMQNYDGDENSKDTQTDDEQEINHYTRKFYYIALFYVHCITLRFYCIMPHNVVIM